MVLSSTDPKRFIILGVEGSILRKNLFQELIACFFSGSLSLFQNDSFLHTMSPHDIASLFIRTLQACLLQEFKNLRWASQHGAPSVLCSRKGIWGIHKMPLFSKSLGQEQPFWRPVLIRPNSGSAFIKDLIYIKSR